MQRIIYFLSLSLLLVACDDGDIINVELDFDKQLAMCGLDASVYFLYDTKTDPSESLSLIFPNNSTTRLIFDPETNNYASTFEINGSSTKFNYRTYDGNPENLICNLLPDANTNIINDYAATSGIVTTLTTFIDDDADGIPSAFEDENSDGDNNPATNPTDSDGDGIPDYLDADDDNDNVLTKNEGHNYSEADGLSKAQDTDGDGIPDYLDNDDDGDGILTNLEDENRNGNPRDDFDEATDTPSVPRYLNKVSKDNFDYKEFNPNTYQRIITVKFQIKNVNLDIISLTDIDFGTFTQTYTIETE
ncbi:hypothetical protein ES711_13575 [Gelidibacter salicanalis]|uniref:Calcium-binding protein n=1 Tax=Gelidibacter salicanalis TaxID=291193 RepID=A0A5C7AEY8_9FLAO|nr:hypothetical protein [Gelidibacter salicanalis]TXE06534.1 hypothetical protein ES711_13575 [Gelidibacter salicanalis]